MTARPIIPLPLILAVCLGLMLMLPGSRTAAAEGPPLVVAFYYAWFDANTWGSGLPTDQPREAYASSDPAAIGRHVAQAQAAGIDALIQSWYGPQEANNQTETNFRMLLDAAAARGSHAAVDFETSGIHHRIEKVSGGGFIGSKKPGIAGLFLYVLRIHEKFDTYIARGLPNPI